MSLVKVRLCWVGLGSVNGMLSWKGYDDISLVCDSRLFVVCVDIHVV